MVDSERLLSAARYMGFTPTLVSEEADLLVVNTCAFIQPAAQEALEAILDLASRRKPGSKLAAVGCLAARYGEELAGGLPEADLIMAPKDYSGFVSAVGAWFGKGNNQAGSGKGSREPGPSEKHSSSGFPGRTKGEGDQPAASAPLGGFETWTRFPGTPPWRAWLKIAEGCDNRCAYCLIPAIRGPLAPRPLEGLLAEAAALAEAGVKELTLVAQDLTAWRGGDSRLDDLVSRLAQIDGLLWLRLMYAYPERLNKRLVEKLARIPKVVPYLDVPIQHASPAVLRRMGRGAGPPLDLIVKLRRWWPGLALRTTLMVGFPGETEADFQELIRFVEEARLDQAGVFKFSPEEGSKAAVMAGQEPPKLREFRRRAVRARQRKISLALNRARVGQTELILVEGASADSDLIMTGRASFQAPEVDGLVIFDGHQPPPGQMVSARFIKAGPYDLLAEYEPQPS
jgi:ribosomal protein S12 methylthiotransferase